MKIKKLLIRITSGLLVMSALLVASLKISADSGVCGGQTITLPFSDVPNTSVFFCSIAAAYFSGLTNGTDATHYSPGNSVSREQMAAFISRTLDQSALRGSRRAALDQYWMPISRFDLQFTTVGTTPVQIAFDGADLWVTNLNSNTVSRVSASDGKLLGTWTGANQPYALIVALGRVFVTGATIPGALYQIDPNTSPAPVTTLTTSVGTQPRGIACDGSRLWTANFDSISIIGVQPVSVTTITSGFIHPKGILYDGSNIWVSDEGDNSLKKLDSNGVVIQSVTVGTAPQVPGFDGSNIWVPNFTSGTVSVVRVRDGSDNSLPSPFVIATLTDNMPLDLESVSFDGQRAMVTGLGGVSLWKLTDLSPLGTLSVGAISGNPHFSCSDGINFWIALSGTGQIARF